MCSISVPIDIQKIRNNRKFRYGTFELMQIRDVADLNVYLGDSDGLMIRSKR